MEISAITEVVRNNSWWLKPSLLLAIPMFVLYYFAWVIYTCFFHPYSDIPGPWFAAISRFWICSSLSGGNIEHIQRDVHRRFGSLVRIAPDEVSVSDPEAVKVIYSIKSGFAKTDFYVPLAINITPNGDHFAQIDERKHAERRKYVNNIYSMSSILESEPYIDACINVFIEKMSEHANSGQEIDLGEWIQWYTFDVIGELFFGQQFGFMRDEHDYGHYIESLDTMLPGVIMTAHLPPLLRALYSISGLMSSTVRDAIRGFNAIRAAGRHWTDVRQKLMEEGKQIARKDLLDKFFQIEADKQGWGILDIQNEACNAILAGSDTTAIALRSIFYHLMKNRAAYAKLVDEIDDFVTKGSISGQNILYTEAVKMPYLGACIKEGMRLHPSVGLGLPRYVPKGGATIAGRFFPEGSRVTMNAAVLHYDETVFGADAASFNPDRWLRDDAARMEKYMLHFGGGSRTCLGKNISLAEMYKLIPEFLRRFDVELVDPNKDWITHNFWFNKQTGIIARVTQRSDSKV